MVKSATLDRAFSALSDPTRRAMLERLARGPATVSELAAPAGISLPGTLKHVRILEEVIARAGKRPSQAEGLAGSARARDDQGGEPAAGGSEARREDQN